MAIIENRISIKGNVSIGATISYPDDSIKNPAIVLIMGTGTTDRDGNENHILREIDDDNSVMTVKKQYGRLASQPIHSYTEQCIKDWLQQFKA